MPSRMKQKKQTELTVGQLRKAIDEAARQTTAYMNDTAAYARLCDRFRAPLKRHGLNVRDEIRAALDALNTAPTMTWGVVPETSTPEKLCPEAVAS